MGVLDDIVGALLKSQQEQGGVSGILGKVLDTVGGYQGIIDMLKRSGLSDRVDSWLSTTASNLPVSPEEIKNALGDQRLQQLAAKFGIPLNQVADILAQYLPPAVDEASPGGKLITEGKPQQ